jgi:hypothetical protein
MDVPNERQKILDNFHRIDTALGELPDVRTELDVFRIDRSNTAYTSSRLDAVSGMLIQSGSDAFALHRFADFVECRNYVRFAGREVVRNALYAIRSNNCRDATVLFDQLRPHYCACNLILALCRLRQIYVAVGGDKRQPILFEDFSQAALRFPCL